MAKINPGDNPVLLQGIGTPVDDTDAANKAYVDANGGGGGGDNITASGGLVRTGDDISIADDGVTTAKIGPQAVTSEEIADGTIVEGDIAAGAITTNRLADDAVSEAKIADIAVKERHLDVTNTPTAGQVLTSATDATQFTWADPVATGITSIVNGGHIDVSTVDGVATLTFDETLDIWEKNDWVQINTGTPSFTDNEILWDTATKTLTVPSVNGRTLENILLSARTGMGVQIRRAQTNIDPVGFTSGFFQILSIDATLTPEQVIIRLLPDETDIFNEQAGATYTYELTVLQFITGGTLDNLTLDGLADTDFSTAPTDTQVLSYDADENQWIPRDAAAPNLASSEIGDLGDVSGTQATNGQILSYVVPEGEVDGIWTPVNEAGGAVTDYNNANYGALRNPNIAYTYTTETSPTNQGEVSISTVDSPDTGYSLLFRRTDVDVKALQGIRLIQIGFGSPIAFATYAVATTSFVDNVDPLLVDITVIDGPLAGNDILASLPAD